MVNIFKIACYQIQKHIWINIFFLCLLIVIYIIMPKIDETSSDPLGNNFTRLKYRGLGIIESINIFGRIPLSFTFPAYQIYPKLLTPQDSLVVVTLRKHIRENFWEGEFIAYYKTNKKRFNGIAIFYCTIQSPSIAMVGVVEGTYYEPSGNIGSYIKNGWGVETLWSDEGIKLEEVFYKNQRWEYFQMYNSTGDIILEKKRTSKDLSF